MKKKSKGIVLGVTLALGLGSMVVANTASASPWGRQVVVKRCHMTRWGQQCRVVRRGYYGRRWKHCHRRVYGPVYYGPQVSWSVRIR